MPFFVLGSGVRVWVFVVLLSGAHMGLFAQISFLCLDYQEALRSDVFHVLLVKLCEHRHCIAESKGEFPTHQSKGKTNYLLGYRICHHPIPGLGGCCIMFMCWVSLGDCWVAGRVVVLKCCSVRKLGGNHLLGGMGMCGGISFLLLWDFQSGQTNISRFQMGKSNK